MLSVAIVANPNSQFPIGNIDIDNWQHFHIGNIQQTNRGQSLVCDPRFCALAFFDKNRRLGFCRGDVHESPVP